MEQNEQKKLAQNDFEFGDTLPISPVPDPALGLRIDRPEFLWLIL